MPSSHTPKLSNLSPILCASILALLSACSSGTGVNHKGVAQTVVDTNANPETDAKAKEQERIARYDQEIKDLTQKLKNATDANAELENDFTNGIRAEVIDMMAIKNKNPDVVDFDPKDIELITFDVDDDIEPSEIVTYNEGGLSDEPIVLSLNSLGLVEEDSRSIIEYLFKILDEDLPSQKLLTAVKTGPTQLAGKKIEFTFPEKIQINPIDVKGKKRTSVWAGAVTGDIVLHPEKSGEPSYVTVTAKVTQSGKDSGAALSVIEEQAKQAPNRSVVELIDEDQVTNNSKLAPSEASALIVLKLDGYKVIGTYGKMDELQKASTDQTEEEFMKRAALDLEKRSDKFSVEEKVKFIEAKKDLKVNP